MVKFLVAILFLVASLVSSDNEIILKRANEHMQSKEQSDVFRAYNDYKNLYLRSTIENDLGLKAESLRGIVESGNLLHIDVSNYATELDKIKPQTQTKIQNKPQEQSKNTQKKQDIQIQPLHKLQSAKWDKEKLILKFDKHINNNQIEALTFHDKSKKRYRYIFDINSAMMTSSHNISKQGVDAIKLAQYSPQSLRLVIENSSEIEVKWSFEDTYLFIVFKADSIEAPQVLATKYSGEKKASDKDKIIVLDAGHGGEDPGAIGFKKYIEKDIVFSISKILGQILKTRGYKVYMTRDRDVFVKLSDRTKFANDKNAHIFVSIHANAVDGRNDSNGIETYFLSPSRSDRAKRVASKENSADMSDMSMYGKDSYLNLLNHHNILASNKLAIDIQRGVLGAVRKQYKDVEDSGVKEGPFWVLVGAQMPSVLVEVGFVTNQKESSRLVDNGYQESLAQGLANGIERYFANCQ